MMRIPAVRPFYSKNELSTLTPTQGLAAVFGVPSQYLYMADSEQSGIDGFRMHEYRTFTHMKDGKQVRLTPYDQHLLVGELLTGTLLRQPAGLIIVNSYPTFFSGMAAGGGGAFLYRMACAIADYRIRTRDMNIDFINLGMTPVEQSKWDDPKAKSVLAWGPITDDFVNYMYVHAHEFLLTYENYTRILLLSVSDIKKSLTRLNIDANTYPNCHIIQLGKDIDKVVGDEKQVEKKAEFIAAKIEEHAVKRGKGRPRKTQEPVISI